MFRLTFILCMTCHLFIATAVAAERAPANPQRTIYAHYMGCFPAGTQSMNHMRSQSAQVRADNPADFQDMLGGRIRHWPLLPPGVTLSSEESADLEIRRASRMGIDGFAIDAWAGGDGARATLNALFKAAEARYPNFHITICLDRSCHPKEYQGKQPEGIIAGFSDSIRWLLDQHGKSPNLARRDGKPLIFGYSSRIVDRSKGPEDIDNWDQIPAAYREIEKRVGTPIYFHFGMEHFFNGMDLTRLPGARPPHNPGEWMVKASGTMAKSFPAVGAFIDGEFVSEIPAMAAAVRAAGAEWSQPMWHQYQNIAGSLNVEPGTDILRKRWELARQTGSTLIQYVTWNDYGEATNLAPDELTRYTIGELNGYYIAWWKNGSPPTTDHDRIYFVYRQYPQAAKTFPFATRRSAPGVLEITTWLTQPATVRLSGRTETWSAPAGLSVHQVPLAVGPVSAILERDGRQVLRLDSPEPVTDRPFREENSMICYSTEFNRLWREDFGDKPPFTASLYGDDDHDGLPNWFEMYWFGKFMDWSTATAAAPDADPDHDGKTNLEEYLAQTDPTKAPPEYSIGYTWDIATPLARSVSVNPDRDAEGTPVWSYLYRVGKPPIPHDGQFLACPSAAPRTPYTGPMSHHTPVRTEGYTQAYTWIDRTSATPPVKLRLRAARECLIALGWTAPISGSVQIECTYAPIEENPGSLSIESVGSGKQWHQEKLTPGKGGAFRTQPIAVKAGETLAIVVDSAGAQKANLILDSLQIKLLTRTAEEKK